MSDVKPTKDLVSDLGTTVVRVDALDPHVEKLDALLNQIIDGLEQVKSFDDAVNSLNSKLHTASTVLGPMGVLPTIGALCSTTKKAVDAVEISLRPVKTGADALERVAKPVREGAEKVESGVSEFDKRLAQLRKTAKELYGKLDTVYSCLEAKDATALMADCDAFSTEVDPAVEGINAALKDLTALCVAVEDEAAKVEDLMESMHDVLLNMGPIYDALDDLDGVFGVIDKALRKRITVPYSFKVKVKVKVKKKEWWKVFYVWEWRWDTKTVDYAFTIQQIVDGVNTGIKWVNDQLMNLAKIALRSVGITMPVFPEIPGLAELRAKIESITSVLPSLNANLDGINAKFDSIEALVLTLEARLQEFTITCE